MGALVSSSKEVFGSFARDEGMVRASSLAFYTALSLAPMVLLFVSITGLLGEGTRARMVEAVQSAVGERAGEIVRTIAEGGSAGSDSGSWWGLAIGVGVLLFSAGGVMAALQNGLNRVWNVKAAPKPGTGGIKLFVRKRVLSTAMVLVLGFLLLVSTVASTAIAMVVPSDGAVWNGVTLVVSAAVFCVLFAALYKVLPDVVIAWRDVWFGAIVTTVLFIVGKQLIAWYIASAGFSDRYGAAGSLVALLVWVYYSAIVLYLGAEVTQVRAHTRGRAIEPDRHAVRIEERVVEPAGG